jgi:hypothetical protein
MGQMKNDHLRLSILSLSNAIKLNNSRILERTRFPYLSSISSAFKLVVPCVTIAFPIFDAGFLLYTIEVSSGLRVNNSYRESKISPITLEFTPKCFPVGSMPISSKQ